MMVTILERFKFRPVKSRMSAFVDRFSMTKSSSESAERMRNPGIRLGLTIGDFSDEDHVYREVKTECYCMLLTENPESGGLVIS